MVVLFVFLMGLFGLLAGFCMDIEFSSYGALVLYAAMMVGIMVLAIYLNTKSPMCIMEYDDRFILLYEHKRVTLYKRDISALRYPVKRERSLCYRFVIDNRKVLDLYGMWGNMRKAASAWEREHGLPTYQDGPINNYKETDCSFSFSPIFSTFITDKRSIFILVMIPAVVRMVSPPYSMFNVVLFLMVLCAAYVHSLYITHFCVEGGWLKIKNTFIKRSNHTIRLSDIKWIMVAEANMCIKLKDGEAIVVRYKFSQTQLQDFSNAFGSIGIPCIC